jgi:choline dehydrogenase-like flavoprotein
MESIVLGKAKKLTHFNLLSSIVVERLIEKNGKIVSVQCVNKTTQERFEIQGKLFILSAGAIHSPATLLRSHLQRFPQHKFIGRYLMRHCNAVIGGLFPFRTNPEKVFHKQVCISDYYQDFRAQTGSATGIIQDIYTPSGELFKHFTSKWLKPLAFINAYVQNLLCIAEDEPNYANRISLANYQDHLSMPIIKIEHQYTLADLKRRNYLIAKARRILAKAGGFLFKTMEIDSFSHAVGSVRFGDKPETAVLNKFCQFFGIKNLFVVDGSFFPSSGGVNPSLTIAANALRVSQHILQQNLLPAK